MKIIPVFDKESQLFVWKLENINLPDNIDEDLKNYSQWKIYGNYTSADDLRDGHPITRMEGNPIDLGECNYKILNEIESLVQNNLHYEEMHQAWPPYYRKSFNFKDTDSYSIIKDSPGSDMGMHYDNFLMYGVLIYNLKDNDDARTTYYDSSTEKLIYEGPTKKGTGIFHLNSAKCLHSGHNYGKEDRIVCMLNIHVKNPL